MSQRRARPCKYCDQLVAPNAKRCPACGGKRPYPPSKAGSAVAFIVVIVAFVWCLTSGVLTPSTPSTPTSKRGSSAPSKERSTSSSSPQPSRRSSIRAGDIAIITAGGDTPVAIGADRKSYSRLVDLAVAGDTEGMMLMVIAGDAMLVDAGTECRVIGVEAILLNLYEVRILEGEYELRSGIVAGEHLQPKR